jgi:predicted ribonuclease YlaK
MIFAEDLNDGQTFLKRLEYIEAHPLYKAAPNKRKDKPALYNGHTAISLDTFFRFKLTLAETLTASEMARLRRIEDEEERHLDQINPDHHVLCSGYAGTGKTLLGLQLALRRKVPT